MIKARQELENLIPYVAGVYKKGLIKLASNENPLGPSPKAIESIKNYIENISLYPDGNCTELRNKLAYKFNLSPENFIIGNGSDEVLMMIAAAYIENGDNAIISNSTFSEYKFVTTLFGGKTKFSDLINGCYDLKKILSLIDNTTKVIFICNPNNPTGTYINKKDFIDFINNVPDNILLVIDEAYVDYVETGDFPDSINLLKDYKNIIILRTFSKIYGLAGLRLGYGIANPEIINNLNKTREPFNVNSLAQIAGISALDDIEFYNLSYKMNLEGKKYLYKELDNLNLFYYKTEANFIFINIKKDCIKAFEELMNFGIIIRPLKSFGFNDAIRVTIGTEKQNKFFIECLKKIL